jgi:3',5'-cyclic AMP phosphodiesterase CpdA
VTVAQITDLHVRRRGHVLYHMPHVVGPLRRALATIAALPHPPHCIVATGDLTESGSPEEYRRLREILAGTRVPVYLIPGNHDRRDALRQVFSDHAYLHAFDEAVLFTIELPALRVIALDTSQGRRHGGYLDALRLRWLNESLSRRRDVPTVIAMHHPPFPTGVRKFDVQPFEGRDALAAIVSAHPQIRRIICGHVHQPLVRPWSGTVGVTAPSTAATLVLRPNAPGLSREPGGLLLHRYENGDIATTLVRMASPPVSMSA